MYLLDTNIFLEILLEQEKSEDCEVLIKSIRSREELFYISSFTLHSIEVIMVREDKNDLLEEFLKYIISSKIILLDTSIEDELHILNLAKEFKLDFDDAFEFYLCRKFNLEIISYDKHFDNLPVKRIESDDLVR